MPYSERRHLGLDQMALWRFLWLLSARTAPLHHFTAVTRYHCTRVKREASPCYYTTLEPACQLVILHKNFGKIIDFFVQLFLKKILTKGKICGIIRRSPEVRAPAELGVVNS